MVQTGGNRLNVADLTMDHEHSVVASDSDDSVHHCQRYKQIFEALPLSLIRSPGSIFPRNQLKGTAGIWYILVIWIVAERSESSNAYICHSEGHHTRSHQICHESVEGHTGAKTAVLHNVFRHIFKSPSQSLVKSIGKLMAFH